MSSFKIMVKNDDGSISIEKVEGFRFTKYLNNRAFKFGYNPASRIITDIASGYRVGVVNISTIAACRGDIKAAAKLAIDALIERVGIERVVSVLNSAPKL